MTTQRIGREIRLAGRPVGEPRPEHFELVGTPVPDPADGQILVRNTWMSVDPYMRGRMDDVTSFLPPFQLGQPLDGGAVGTVVGSRSAAVPVGTTVAHFLGWREYAVLDAAAATVVDLTIAPAQAYLGALGTTGLTAYVAVTDVAPVRPGDTVFVSGAAGAVGSVAGQLARFAGAGRVIGSAGSAEKAAKLTAGFGLDAAINYKAGPVGEQLHDAAPDGIDVYIDNVGGDHLAAAIDAARTGARFALIGAVSGYNAVTPVPGPSNLYRAYWQEVTMRGMLVSSHFARFPEWIARGSGLLRDGSLRTEDTVVDGLEQAPAALLGVLRGANIGKMLVQLDG